MNLFEFRKLPNRLTISRMVLVFIFVMLANIRSDMDGLFGWKVSPETETWVHLAAYIVAILAALTDFFDGYLARKYHLESDFGKLMDPLADKIFVVGTFVMMAEYKLMPGWIIIVVLTREFMVTGLRMLATRKGIVIAADKFGKIKTVLQMIALLIGGACWVLRFDLHPQPWWSIWYVLLLFMTVVTLFSGVNYFLKNKELYLEYT